MPPDPVPEEPVYPVDLQTHTTFSDGTETPTELVAHAAHLGIRVLAITDHDSVLGVEEALAAGQHHGVQVIPALEFSTMAEQERDYLDVNILGYGIHHQDPGLQAVLREVIESRIEQKIHQIEKLQSYGLDVPVEEVLARAGGVPGRPHIAQVALERNPHRFTSIRDVFEQYLSPGAPNSTYVQRRFSLRVEQAIALVHQAGGVAVLAHPGLYSRIRNVDGAVQRMVEAGLDGIEVHYPYIHERRRGLPITDPAEVEAYFDALADRLGLLKTGGSDYHGSRKPNRLGQAGLSWEQWETLHNQCGWERNEA